MLLKTKNPGTTPQTSNQSGFNTNEILSPAEQLMQPLNQLYVKEQQQQQLLALQQQQQQSSNSNQNKSRLVELLNYPKSGGNQNTVGGVNNMRNNQQQQQQNTFSSFNTPNIGQNWNNMKMYV